MSKRIDEIGKKYGILTVIADCEPVGRVRFVLCECECGNVTRTAIGHLRTGHTKSCGCHRASFLITHGRYKTRTYAIWNAISGRCGSSGCYKNISICERWKNFENFYSDMGDVPKGLTLDRIDTNGNYEPSNCRWASRTMQSRNTRLIRSSNTSGYRGVSWSKAANKWTANISINKKYKYLGLFTDKLDAARAYNREASKYEGFPLNEV